MAIIDTTDVIDSSIYLKAQLKHNMVGENYYIENLQDKRNADWEFRYNVVDIEEELHKQINYTKELPCYTPIDVVIQSAKDEMGEELGTDYAVLAFRELFHPNEIGYRYRFDFDHVGEGMQDLSTMSEEDKYYNTSVWLAINKSPLSPGNSLMVRRCNASIALVGSPTREYSNITEVRYEPVIIENSLKVINVYSNMTVPIPQAEWYLTCQLNYFTNFIKINDRMIFAGVSLDDRSNNSTYKVKAVVKTSSTKTFSRPGSADLENIPLLILGLDKDLVDEGDDFELRVANQAPIYSTEEIPESVYVPEDDYVVEISEPYDLKILLGDTMTKTVYLANEAGQFKANFEFSVELKGIPEEEYDNYFKFEVIEDEDGFSNTFSIKNLKSYQEDFLSVQCTAVVQNKNNGNNRNNESIGNNGNNEEMNEPEYYTQTYDFELGGFY